MPSPVKTAPQHSGLKLCALPYASERTLSVLQASDPIKAVRLGARAVVCRSRWEGHGFGGAICQQGRPRW